MMQQFSQRFHKTLLFAIHIACMKPKNNHKNLETEAQYNIVMFYPKFMHTSDETLYIKTGQSCVIVSNSTLAHKFIFPSTLTSI